MEAEYQGRGMITDQSELDGSCYIEILPGTYQGKCWNEGSVFFTEETFAYIETSIEREVPAYDHYGFNVISKQEWARILKRLDVLAALLRERPSMEAIKQHVDFFYGDGEEEFRQSYDEHIAWLADLVHGFRTWLREQLEMHEYISVLGI
ncbi:hypothetical protein [Paenibacillus hubeiensis]|uniref:hypothetical protein n=1 Tax=Paenibacillus hubeiensis TaxID=3077330 RepID=UPI0031BBCC15